MNYEEFREIENTIHYFGENSCNVQAIEAGHIIFIEKEFSEHFRLTTDCGRPLTLGETSALAEIFNVAVRRFCNPTIPPVTGWFSDLTLRNIRAIGSGTADGDDGWATENLNRLLNAFHIMKSPLWEDLKAAFLEIKRLKNFEESNIEMLSKLQKLNFEHGEKNNDFYRIFLVRRKRLLDIKDYP